MVPGPSSWSVGAEESELTASDPQLLLPFSLSAYADHGYKNRSLIAMFAVGGVCLIGYGIWEAYGAKFPSAPRRILNWTVISAVVIDFVYLLAGYMQLAYLSSYVYIVTDLSPTHWNCGSSIPGRIAERS